MSEVYCKDCRRPFRAKINPHTKQPYIRCYDCFQKKMKARREAAERALDGKCSCGRHYLSFDSRSGRYKDKCWECTLDAKRPKEIPENYELADGLNEEDEFC